VIAVLLKRPCDNILLADMRLGDVLDAHPASVASDAALSRTPSRSLLANSG
jgi:hypothetical protein